MIEMLKGKIWLADLHPNLGKKHRSVRPVAIINGNFMNKPIDAGQYS